VAIARENKAGEVSGSADIESEVDVVLVILKNHDGSRSLHITKNRFSEHEGVYPLVLTSRGFNNPSEGEHR
jgi:predicted ATP-dependent serine protease